MDNNNAFNRNNHPHPHNPNHVAAANNNDNSNNTNAITTTQIARHATKTRYYLPYTYWRSLHHNRTYAKSMDEFQIDMFQSIYKLLPPRKRDARLGFVEESILGDGRGAVLSIRFRTKGAPSDKCYTQHEEKLVPLWRKFATTLQNCNYEHVMVFDISKIQLTGSVLGMLVPALAAKNITTLTLGYNELGREGIASLSELLEQKSPLAELEVIGNPLEDVQAAIRLSVSISDHPTLRKLKLQECAIGRNPRILQYFVHAIYNVAYVDFRSNDIDARGAALFTNLLESNPKTLDRLVLTNNEIDDDVAVLFANALRVNTNLQKLVLRDTDITHRGEEALARALLDDTSLLTVASSNHVCKVELRGKTSRCIRNLNNSPIPEKNRAKKISQTLYSIDENGLEALNFRCFQHVSKKLMPQALHLVVNHPKEKRNNTLANVFDAMKVWVVPVLCDVEVVPALPNANTIASIQARIPRMPAYIPDVDPEENKGCFLSECDKSKFLSYQYFRIHGRSYAKAMGNFQRDLQAVTQHIRHWDKSQCKCQIGKLTKYKSLKIKLDVGGHSNQCYLLHDEGLIPQWQNFARAFEICKERISLFEITKIQVTCPVFDVLTPAFAAKNLTALLLRNNDLGRDEFLTLSKFIEMNSQLERLDVVGSPIEDIDVARRLSKSICKNRYLNQVKFEDCNIGRNSEILSAMSTIVKHASSVDFRSNDIGSEGATLISNILATNPRTEQIILNNNEFNDSDAVSFANMLRVNDKLQKLSLRYNDLTEVGVATLTRSLLDETSIITVSNSNNSCKVLLNDDLHCVRYLNDSLVARRNREKKVALTLFDKDSRRVNVNPHFYDDVPVELMPTVLNFVLKYAPDDGNSLSNMFELLKMYKMPSLFSFAGASKKVKRKLEESPKLAVAEKPKKKREQKEPVKKTKDVNLITKHSAELRAAIKTHIKETLTLMKESTSRGETAISADAMEKIRVKNMNAMKVADFAKYKSGGRRSSERELTGQMAKAERDAVKLFTKEANNVPKKTKISKRKRQHQCQELAT